MLNKVYLYIASGIIALLLLIIFYLYTENRTLENIVKANQDKVATLTTEVTNTVTSIPSTRDTILIKGGFKTFYKHDTLTVYNTDTIFKTKYSLIDSTIVNAKKDTLTIKQIIPSLSLYLRWNYNPDTTKTITVTKEVVVYKKDEESWYIKPGLTLGGFLVGYIIGNNIKK